ARLVCTAEGLDTASGDQELSFAIKAALAREQWKQFKRRSDETKRRAVEDLGIHVGPPPFGYERERYSGEPLKLADRKSVNAVRAAFELRATGAYLGDVVRLLDKRIPGGPSKSGAWNRNTVSRILANRVYLGEARGGGYAKPDAHPAIVDQATFDACQAVA